MIHVGNGAKAEQVVESASEFGEIHLQVCQLKIAILSAVLGRGASGLAC